MKKTLKERILKKIEIDANGCWNWVGCTLKSGYGQIRDGYSKIPVHRASFSVFVGDIPFGMFVCHKCDNKKCCNPDHLFVGTHQDNMDDKVNKGRQQRLGGELCGRHKLSSIDVIKIRSSKKTGYALAKEYDVDFGTIYAILKRKTWKNI